MHDSLTGNWFGIFITHYPLPEGLKGFTIQVVDTLRPKDAEIIGARTRR